MIMTPTEFLAKFPATERNDNFLENVACPACGRRSGFLIDAHVSVHVTDQSIDDESGTEFEPQDKCVCDCGKIGKLIDFTIDGLDDEIASRQ
jgi:hypothetical protein